MADDPAGPLGRDAGTVVQVGRRRGATARVAAVVVNKDIVPATNPWEVFGPMTVAMKQAENAMIQDKPEVVLKIGSQRTGRGFPARRLHARPLLSAP